MQIDVFQSMWAMERRRPDGKEWSLEEKIERIQAGGFAGVDVYSTPSYAQERDRWIDSLLSTDLDITLCSFPSPKEGLEPTIEVAKSIRDRVRYINLIPKVTPNDLEHCARHARDWLELGAEADIPVYIETHRHCMTNDLMFTLHLLEAVPELMMVGDLSHVLVNQEWGGIPTEAPEDVLTAEEHSYLSRLLRRVESFQGRVATREQIQIPLDSWQSEKWYTLFKSWWEEGFRCWRDRHRDEPDARFVFLCELGPPEYALTDKEGWELSDRFLEAQVIKRDVEALWQRLDEEEGSAS